MFFNNVKKRKKIENAFMQKIDTNEKLLINNQSDCLIKIIKIIKTDLNLTRAIIIILCELIYDSKLYKQTSKKTHRLEQKEKMFYYVLRFDT